MRENRHLTSTRAAIPNAALAFAVQHAAAPHPPAGGAGRADAVLSCGPARPALRPPAVRRLAVRAVAAARAAAATGVLAVALACAAGPGGPDSAAAQSADVTARAAAAVDDPAVDDSLFVRLLGRGVPVPFPYERLLASMEARSSAADAMQAVHALVPFGRSLQRAAADPDYLRFPRILSAAVGGSIDGESLADRVFVAYQERSAALEVISYSPRSGRFEFALVEDYRAAGARRVRPAPRALCLSCHANAGPLFPAPPWSETQANDALARQLSAVQATFHGVAVRRDAAAVDDFAAAVNRANLIDVWQSLWGQGCAAAQAVADCRSEALVHAVAAALDGGRLPVPSDAFVDRIAAALAAAWPGGLAVPDASLTDRDPLRLAADAPAALRTAAAAAVSPAAEASLARPARDRLVAADARGVAARFAAGLARGFARPDVDALAASLARHGGDSAGVLRTALASACSRTALCSRVPFGAAEAMTALVREVGDGFAAPPLDVLWTLAYSRLPEQEQGCRAGGSPLHLCGCAQYSCGCAQTILRARTTRQTPIPLLRLPPWAVVISPRE